MIRRNPTLIPMSDLDVQDIRDLVNKQKAEAMQAQLLVQKMKRIAENPTMQKEDVEMIEQLKAATLRQERARRLGLIPGHLVLPHLSLRLNSKVLESSKK